MSFIIKKHKNEVLYVAKVFLPTSEEDEQEIEDIRCCFYIDKKVLRVFRIRTRMYHEGSSLIPLIKFIENFCKENEEDISIIEVNCYLTGFQDELKSFGYKKSKENYFYKSFAEDILSKAIYIGRGTYERAKQEVADRGGKFRLPNSEDVKNINKNYTVDITMSTVSFNNSIDILSFSFKNEGVVYNNTAGTISYITSILLDNNDVCFVRDKAQLNCFTNTVYKEASIILLENN